MKTILRMLLAISVIFLMMGGLILGNVYAGDKCENPMEARPIPINYSECMNVCAECNRQEVAKCDQYRGDTTKHKTCLSEARKKFDRLRQECTIFNK